MIWIKNIKQYECWEKSCSCFRNLGPMWVKWSKWWEKTRSWLRYESLYHVFSLVVILAISEDAKTPVFQVHPEGKYVVDIDKSIDITKLTPSTRVALRNDSYVLHLVLPSKVDPLVNLMKVEKVPDSTYDMIGGLDQQIKEIKEVCFVSRR